jgi:hypothetical protein
MHRPWNIIVYELRYICIPNTMFKFELVYT